MRGKIYTKSKLQVQFEDYKAQELLRKLGISDSYNKNVKEIKKETGDSGFKGIGELQGMEFDLGQDKDDDGIDFTDGKM